jgi:hypothetical protein
MQIAGDLALQKLAGIWPFDQQQLGLMKFYQMN